MMVSSYFSTLFSRVLRGVLMVVALLLAALPVYASGGKDSPLPVAMHTYGIWNPASNERFDAAVWYPAKSFGRSVQRDGRFVPYGTPRHIAEGFYPVILLSHDTASSRFAHNDLAIALASSGFIVIAPTHTGDNINDCSRIYSAELLLERPRQLLRSLETVLASNEFAPYVDESRIGVLGIGFGAITAAQLAGLEPATHILPQLCSGKAANDLFCTSWSAKQLKATAPAMKQYKTVHGRNAFTPGITTFAPALEAAAPTLPEKNKTNGTATTPVVQEQDNPTLDAIASFFGFTSEEPPPKPEAPPEDSSSPATQAEFVYLLDFQGGDMFGGTNSGAKFVELEAIDTPLMRFIVEKAQPQPAAQVEKSKKHGKQPHLRPANTRAIRAVAFVSPAGGMLFSTLETQSPIPAAIVASARDELYPYGLHGRQYESVFHLLTPPLLLANVDHYSLFAPCTAEMQSSLSGMCGRLVGENREMAQELRDNTIVPFFRKTLGMPLAVPPPSGLVAAPLPKVESPPPPAGQKK